MPVTLVLLQIITNLDLLAVNQDALGVQATCVKNCCGRDTIWGGVDTPINCHFFSSTWQVWSGPLSGGAWVVVVVNRFDTDQEINMDWSLDAHVPAGRYAVKDLWTHNYIAIITVQAEGNSGDTWNGSLEFHNNWAFKLEPVGEKAPPGVQENRK